MRKSLIGQLAIRLGRQTTPTKLLVMLKLLGVIVALALSTAASAIGMGGIDVDSSLGQPLNADIDLVSVSRTQKSSLVARLASPDVYKGAGLEYPYGNKFLFQIENRANGQPYLKVSSEKPVNDPFVSLLVELTWSSGKLLREYTFLLDPPGYVAERPAPAKVQPVAPQAIEPAARQAELEPTPAVEPISEAPQPARVPKVEKPVEATAPRALEKMPAASAATGDITVMRGDTLTRIARQYKPADVSLEQMLVALYRANAEQFDGNNMNRIRAGKILRLPDQSELMEVTQPDAKKEIRAHVADWNTYRQKLASAASLASQPQDAQQVATGKIASSIADKTPVARESAKEVLKLSKGEMPGDSTAKGAAAGMTASAEARKNAAQEEAIARGKAAKDEQARVALLEKNLKDMERLAELKSGAAAVAASAVKPKPVAKATPKAAEPEEPSFLDEITGEPLYLAGGAAVLLGLGGLGFMMYRRKHAYVSPEEGPEDDIGAITGHMTSPAMPSPDTGDFTTIPEEPVEAAPLADEVDPISEADLFLNFGRDAQAEDILKEALRNTPNNHQIHLRLLGIYANRKDANAFSDIARQLQDSGDEEAWQQAVVMGRKLDPNNPLYGAAKNIEDADSAIMKTAALGATAVPAEPPAVQEKSPSPEVDFDLGMPSEDSDAPSEPELPAETESTAALPSAEKDAARAAGMDFDVASADSSMAAPDAMDFDITSTRPPMPAATEEAEEATVSGLDFDITSTHPPMPAATEQADKTASSEMDDLIFDVTSTNPSIPASQPELAGTAEPAKDAQEDSGMEFTLDIPTEEVAEKPAPAAQPADVGLSGISLNLDDVAEPGEAAPEVHHDEQWHEVATKLDLARAYQEMGDLTGAREIIEEVLREGDEEQRQTAQTLLDQLG